MIKPVIYLISIIAQKMCVEQKYIFVRID